VRIPEGKDARTKQRMQRARTILRAGIVVLMMPALACTSSTDLETIQSQLSDVQLQLLQLQKQGPTKTELADLEATLGERMEALLAAQAEVRADLELLTSRIEQLEAKLEDTNFRLAQLSQQIVATNQELQEVRNAAEEARARVASPQQQPAVNPTDPRTLYDTAYNDYLQGNYDLAILGFRQYLDSYRGTDLADNATYWIGECFYRQGKFQKAIDQFDAVLTRFDSSDRTASALLKKGYAYLELGQRAQGVVQLQSVICEHANTDEAHLAAQRLRELGIDVEC